MSKIQSKPNLSTSFDTLSGGGALGELVRSHDWSQTDLGPLDLWPQSLKTSVSLILNSQHPMWIGWGKERTFLYNDAYIDILGSSKHPWALGRPFREVWSEIWDVVSPLADKVFEKGEASFIKNVRLFMKKPRGHSEETYLQEEYYSFSYSPIRDESGQVRGLFCPSADITDKHLSERRLQTLSELSAKTLVEKTIRLASHSTVETLAKNSDDCPFVLLYLHEPKNQSAFLAKAVGVPEGVRPISLERIELLSESNHTSSIWPIADVMRRGVSSVVSVRGLDAVPRGLADQLISEAIVLPLIAPGQGESLGVLISGVNPARQLDTDYRTFFDLISRQVATAIQNAKSAEHEKKRLEALAEIDRAKTTFFSNVSHEFRTPLTLMLGPLEDNLADSNGCQFLQHRERDELAYRNALRLLKLVNSLLDFSRIEAGRIKAVYCPTDLAKITTDLASVFRSAIEKAGLRLIVNTSNFMQPAFVDREMWEKIIFNLLSNAFKFTFKGEIEVRLIQNGNMARLSVRDTGTGIPKAELPRLFERFHRVAGAQGRTHEGTGIGLALVQELVKLHGGTITVRSQLGAGTEFIVDIPLGKEHLSPEHIAKTDTTKESPGKLGDAFVEEALRWLPDTDLETHQILLNHTRSDVLSADKSNSPIKILLVDDNADMRTYLKNLLKTMWNVEAAENGQEAFEMACDQPFDLILSDIMMPKLDGFGLLNKIKSNSKTKSIPVILLSARADEDARIEGLQAGADDYLVKPFSAKELLARVQTHLQLNKMRREAERTEQEVVDILESMSEAFFSVDKNWIITRLNAQHERVTRYKREEQIGKNLLELFFPTPQDRQTKYWINYHKAMKDRVAVQFEDYYPPFDLWTQVRACPTPDGGLAIFFTDITKQKKAQLRLQKIFDTIPIFVGFLNSNGIITVVNQSAAISMEKSKEDLVGRPFWDCPWWKLLPSTIAPLKSAFAQAVQGIPQRYDSQYVAVIKGEQKIRWIDFSMVPLVDGNPRIEEIVVTGFDITERRLAEEGLRSSQERLQAAIRSRDEFLSVASHELKTPITSLKLQLQMTNRRIQPEKGLAPPPEKLAEVVHTSLKQTDRLTELIEDLLDVARIQSGKLIFNFETMNIKEVLEEVIARFSDQLDQVKCKVEMNVSPDLNTQWDRSRIEQVFVNLISNAIKYAPNKPIIISAATQNDTIILIVQDFGPGIPKELQTKIFERFERATSSRNINGIGLGLYIVRQIVNGHRGNIRVESEEGHGSTFIVEIPIYPLGRDQNVSNFHPS